jgi:hypothetical protein
MGRPARLDEAGVARAYAMADEGRRGIEIATALAVSQATISRCLACRPAATHPRLDLDEAIDTSEAALTVLPACPSDLEGGGDVDQVETAEQAEVDEEGPAPMVSTCAPMVSTCIEHPRCDRLDAGSRPSVWALGHASQRVSMTPPTPGRCSCTPFWTKRAPTRCSAHWSPKPGATMATSRPCWPPPSASPWNQLS